MEEQLITFETAKLAKEKGFDLLVYAGYIVYLRDSDLEDGISYLGGDDYACTGFKDILYNLNKSDEEKDLEFSGCRTTSAPSQSLLQKWLREEHKIHISINPIISKNDWETRVYKINPQQLLDYIKQSHVYLIFNTYELALEKGLQEALKLIK